MIPPSAMNEIGKLLGHAAFHLGHHVVSSVAERQNKVYAQRHDLRGANLRGANLQGANLQAFNLFVADLQGANLLGANLQEAVLTGADLQGANLQGANLESAKLFVANLQGANLLGAKGLLQEQIEEAIGNETTKLPERVGLRRPEAWSKSFEEQIRLPRTSPSTLSTDSQLRAKQEQELLRFARDLWESRQMYIENPDRI